MTLYRVPGDKMIDPDTVENRDIVKAVKRNAHWRSFERLIKTYEEGIEWVVQNGGRVQWTKTGALFGHQTKRPFKDVEHLWSTITDAVGDTRLCTIAVGTFMQLIIAQRDETWLCVSRETGYFDPLTGEEIRAYEYWVDNTYTPPSHKRSSVNDLISHWGARS